MEPKNRTVWVSVIYPSFDLRDEFLSGAIQAYGSWSITVEPSVDGRKYAL
jgi:hypothetical protein